ncbi:hypothetical protein [Candidatus Magnetaquicoccus inordinatus]|uniref:hypothetical protein n=1 Tax=Candidatus Magnetaquicoccus inordinatus TaxID=2496818 RepID=UPI00102C15DA|nr:hypothetical protein [Candidatus Magnetaquicoccus inordinatus]
MTRDTCSLILPDQKVLLQNRQDPYLFTREKIARTLIEYTLLDSYHNFNFHGIPYPFVSPSKLRPGTPTNAKEFELQNSALVILVDGTIPEKMRKNFRFREGNRLYKENLIEVAPDLTELNQYKWSMRHTNHEKFNALLKMLLPLDYALLVQRIEDGESWPFELTHFHVKVERLLDNAIRGLAVYLNYIEHSLYERGEEYVDLLEKKFFEYFNFYHNASGRRCAAALAAQLLAWKKIPATVFISSQQTRRLTFLTTSSSSEEIVIEQYLLLKVDAELQEQLTNSSKNWPVDILKDFLFHGPDQSTVAILRARFEHTEASRPTLADQPVRTVNPREKWIRLKDEALIPIHSKQSAKIGCSLVYRRPVSELEIKQGSN